MFACLCAKSLQSCQSLCDRKDCSLPGSSIHGILQARIPEWVAMPSSRDLPIPGIELRSPALQVGGFLYHLSHQGSPRRLEWVAYPFSSGSSQPRNGTWVSCLAGGFFTAELPGKTVLPAVSLYSHKAIPRLVMLLLCG